MSRGTTKYTFQMEGGNYLTAGDMALWNDARDGRYHRNGAATTGIGLAAGLGGGALLLAIAGLWGINQASKARSEGAMKAIDVLAQNAIQESARTHSITLDVNQYLRNNAASNANAFALNGGFGGGQTCPFPVSIFKPATPCDC